MKLKMYSYVVYIFVWERQFEVILKHIICLAQNQSDLHLNCDKYISENIDWSKGVVNIEVKQKILSKSEIVNMSTNDTSFIHTHSIPK